MAAQFEPAWAYLMSWEDPGLTGKVTVDSGGLTRWGISQRAYPGLDIRNLSQADAKALAEKDYFLAIHCWMIKDQRVASKLFDMAYNMGIGTAVKLCQRALLLSGDDCDGVAGPKTLEAINSANPDALLAYLVREATDHYKAIALAKPEDGIYLKGWLRRAQGLPPVDAFVNSMA